MVNDSASITKVTNFNDITPEALLKEVASVRGDLATANVVVAR
jgi:hypothetical protein